MAHSEGFGTMNWLRGGEDNWLLISDGAHLATLWFSDGEYRWVTADGHTGHHRRFEAAREQAVAAIAPVRKGKRRA